jgi:hypothetical protein
MPNQSAIKQKSIHVCDPASVLQAAIEQINIFTQDAASLDIADNGRLVALNTKGLEKVICLARAFIGPILSEHIRQKQEVKLNQIKKELLQARDVIQSHFQLIERFKAGNPHQRTLAFLALEAIKRYNAIVDNASSVQPKAHSYNYERQKLLLDSEIKGQQIRLPHAVSVRYDSHPNHFAAQNRIQQLSHSFCKIKSIPIASTHKKNTQVMIDAFRMKSIRKIQQDLDQKDSLGEILNLIKQTPIEIDEVSLAPFIKMCQSITIMPGSTLVLTAIFEKPSSEARLMSIPILKELYFKHESTQTGYPYPSQYAACALCDLFIDANPLRSEKVPIFSQIEQRKKKLAQDLLFDTACRAKAKHLYRLNKQSINANIQAFIRAHRNLMQALMQAAARPVLNAVLDDFYEYVASNPYSFDTLSGIQQQILEMAIIYPAKRLQEQWLNGYPPLREGTDVSKLKVAGQILKRERKEALAALELMPPLKSFISIMADILGQAGQAVTLQYMSEKIGFAPVKLSRFEQSIQMYAFKQLLSFLDEMQEGAIEPTWQSIEKKMQDDCTFFTLEDNLAANVSQELKIYFESRFNEPLIPKRVS